MSVLFFLFLIIVLKFTFSFLLVAGFTWILCWALPLIGISTIGSWPIIFSWPLAIILHIIFIFFKTRFSIKIEKE